MELDRKPEKVVFPDWFLEQGSLAQDSDVLLF